MIFVMVGTNEAPFDRLLEVFAGQSFTERLVIQCGSSSLRPAGATCVDFLSYESVVEHVRTARMTVCHAGVGSIMTVLAENRRPVVVPRRRRFGEAVDDHQVPLGRRLHETGLVHFIEDPSELAPLIGQRLDPPAQASEPAGNLSAELREYVAARTATRRSPIPMP